MSDFTASFLNDPLTGMHLGWFILLTSVLSYWRVKRWERSILSSSDTGSSAPTEGPLSRLRAVFGGRSLLRHGFSLSRDEDANPPNPAIISVETATRMSQGETSVELSRPSDPEVRLAQAWAEEARLQNDLRAAGLM